MPKIRDYLIQDSPFDLRSGGPGSGPRPGYSRGRGGGPGKRFGPDRRKRVAPVYKERRIQRDRRRYFKAEGTSEGAKKGWESRRGGRASESLSDQHRGILKHISESPLGIKKVNRADREFRREIKKLVRLGLVKKTGEEFETPTGRWYDRYRLTDKGRQFS